MQRISVAIATLVIMTAANAVEPRPAIESTPHDQSQTIGQFPEVAQDHPNVAAIREAAQSGEHAERLTPMMMPRPFDAAAYQADRQAYLDVLEPGRVYQMARPGKDVPQIHAEGSTVKHITQGDVVTLTTTNVPPGWPVSFLSFGGGRFSSNQLQGVTVVADERGTASVVYEATAGTLYTAHVGASSPMASGSVLFVIDIAPRAAAKGDDATPAVGSP